MMCSPGISSSPDAEAGAERLLSLVRPGGRLTVAVWSQGALELLPEPIRRAVVPERPCLADVPRPARLLRPAGTPRPLRDRLAARSLSCTDVRYVPLAVPGVLRSVVSGTGRRGLLDGMGLPFELP
ncbi:hypothetical protein KYY02_12935 [Streptomyces pimonensis]|uniref:Methyltransferase n=1 Tax=Streptomyces pimonensis TaxID=2860288 RepID=A0ABV4IXY7_9ACTN